MNSSVSTSGACGSERPRRLASFFTLAMSTCAQETKAGPGEVRGDKRGHAGSETPLVGQEEKGRIQAT